MHEKNFADLKYSKLLKDIFSESEWWWVYGKTQKKWFVSERIHSSRNEERYPALITDMLLERLPKGDGVMDNWHIFWGGNQEWACQGYFESKDGYPHVFTDKKLCNALAKMLIYLNNEGLLEGGDNGRN